MLRHSHEKQNTKTHNLQADKTNKYRKEQKNFELSASITLNDAQPSCSLSLSIFHPWQFRVSTFYPSQQKDIISMLHKVYC
jgi:hypothetical protein